MNLLEKTDYFVQLHDSLVLLSHGFGFVPALLTNITISTINELVQRNFTF